MELLGELLDAGTWGAGAGGEVGASGWAVGRLQGESAIELHGELLEGKSLRWG